MNPEYIVLGAIGLAVAYFFLRPRSSPKEKSFRCGRCSSLSQHTPRTINAWRDGKTKFFCNSCHAEWVRSHPHQRAPVRSSGGGSRPGCLGVLACLVFIPVAVVLSVLCA
jgi:hypothetical protein